MPFSHCVCGGGGGGRSYISVSVFWKGGGVCLLRVLWNPMASTTCSLDPHAQWPAAVPHMRQGQETVSASSFKL